uniref:Uncharacterized protein n=1 Tax=Meloidogyne enterolobii TaxID=390850 RepID=A0A6V7WPC8_MELEN|nr:unnamed protein product [Meloidogyne enterolobii]
MSIDFKATLAMIDINDLDGFKKVLEDANRGNISNIKELLNEMEEKCYSLLEALRMIYVKLTIIFDNLDDDGKRLIKNLIKTIIIFLKKDVKNAYNSLDDKSKNIIDIMFEDLGNNLPSLKPLIASLKFVLSSDVTIKFNGQTSSANILGPGSVDGLN